MSIQRRFILRLYAFLFKKCMKSVEKAIFAVDKIIQLFSCTYDGILLQ